MSKYLIKNKKGFTLIELMATVAIIGVLAAIAIPNYMKYQLKARQAEAKILLGSAFLAEKAYNQDQHTYTGCIGLIGFNYDNPAGAYYGVGFNGVTATKGCFPYSNQQTAGNCFVYSWTGSGSGATNKADCGSAAAVNNTYFIGQQGVVAKANAGNAGDANSTVTGNSFNIIAAAGLDPSDATKQDVWAVDATKTIFQLTSGI